MDNFLQFYKSTNYLYNDKMKYTELMNGLSHIKPEGKHYWLDWAVPEMPIKSGNVYASVWYKQTAIRLFEIAKENPDLNIFIGGPILCYDLNLKRKNFHVLREGAEHYFSKSEWNLPKFEIEGDIGYCVSLIQGSGCYWGKCTFCKQKGDFFDRNLDKIPIVKHNGHKYIWLHTLSMTPEMMKRYYPTFENRNDVSYQTYIRGDKAMIKTYSQIKSKLQIDPKNLGFLVGIEFPSDHMLQHMKKGVSVQDYLDFIELANDSVLSFSFIVGWKNTTWDDVKEVDKFLNKLSKITKPNTITTRIYQLHLVENKYNIWDEYKDDKIIWYDDHNITKYFSSNQYIWNVRMGEPVLNKEQNEIKTELKKLYYDFPWLDLEDRT